MSFSIRMKSIIDMVTPCGVIADIGCDHCLTLIYALWQKKGINGIGCDIRKGPLLTAKENLIKFKISDRIDLRLGNGLFPLEAGEANAVIISGMGGHLINDILNDGILVVNSLNQLILQPQLDVDAVRRNLHNIGFKIVDEDIMWDYSRYYTVIKAEPNFDCPEIYNSESEYMFGKILLERKDSRLKRHISATRETNTRILKRIAINLEEQTENCLNRINKLENENKIIEEVLKCL